MSATSVSRTKRRKDADRSVRSIGDFETMYLPKAIRDRRNEQIAPTEVGAHLVSGALRNLRRGLKD